MLSSLILYVVVYTLLLGTVITVGFALQRQKERVYIKGDENIDPKELIVLIPFRNEEHRIQDLLDNIQQLKILPSSFIFIDDHSTDNTVDLINQSLKEIDHEVMSLPESITGKKRALRYATEHTQSKYILTMDADVVVDANYFAAISELGDGDMYVLPVIMKPKKWVEHFYEIDLILVTAANAGLAGLARPIMASGANLLYKRSAFAEVDDIESHIHAASGDDTYLLRDFRVHKKDVRLLTDPKCAITTETPQSFREFIDQRLRWIGKTGDIKDNLSTTLAILQAILTIVFFGLIIWMLILGDWKLLGILFGLKSVTDLALFYPYFARIKRLSSWIYIPIYELLFPLYTLLILALVFTYKPKWKGREIYVKEK
jgi:cellulose synthase/poly-beta-1,6-N-acetylglucosamine synthase-like glycosyltransferase